MEVNAKIDEVLDTAACRGAAPPHPMRVSLVLKIITKVIIFDGDGNVSSINWLNA